MPSVWVRSPIAARSASEAADHVTGKLGDLAEGSKRPAATIRLIGHFRSISRENRDEKSSRLDGRTRGLCRVFHCLRGLWGK
jgi:hypothetical protein